VKRFNDRHWRSHAQESEVNPLEYIANIADAMLILSVGFMLALVANWNIDISTAGAQRSPDIIKEEALAFDEKDISRTDGEVEELMSGDLQKLGTVYFDSNEGRYYIVDLKEE